MKTIKTSCFAGSEMLSDPVTWVPSILLICTDLWADGSNQPAATGGGKGKQSGCRTRKAGKKSTQEPVAFQTPRG